MGEDIECNSLNRIRHILPRVTGEFRLLKVNGGFNGKLFSLDLQFHCQFRQDEFGNKESILFWLLLEDM